MKLMMDHFEANVRKYNDKTAIRNPETGEQLTYGELNERAAKIASSLRKDGIKKSDIVAVVVPKGVDAVCAIVGALKAGAAVAPLNENYPVDRLQYIYADCNAKAVITKDYIIKTRDCSPPAEETKLLPDDAAVLIYTSGSTGKPKGVRCDHRAVFDSVKRQADLLSASDDDVMGIGAPLFFVAGIQFLLVGLFCGMTNIIIPASVMRNPVQLSKVIAAERVTISFISPKIIKFFNPGSSSLRIVIAGGERLSGICPKEYRLLNGYGLSESFGGVMGFFVDKVYENTPIGKPAGNEKAYVLDEEGNEAEEGELCLTGNFADCYINLTEDSKKTFRPNPFSDKDGYSNMLRTGDLVRRLPDGNIVYLNRKDWMIKINGQRVEPGEIEAELAKIDGIKDAAVKNFTDARGSAYIAAYYVSEGELSEDKIRTALKEKLPEYMIPSFFVKLDNMPLNANGKLDRNSLMEPEAKDYQTEYAAPETSGQKELCAAFEKVLSSEKTELKIGIDDDFFALGGDSVKAAELLLIAADKLHFSMADIYSGKTVRKICEIAEKKENRSVIDDDRSASAEDTKVTEYPLTSMERGMYLEQKINSESTSYNLNLGVYIRGVNENVICAAMNKILAAHEVFHSHYGEKNGDIYRIFEERIPVIENGAVLDRDSFEKKLKEPGKPFDLEAQTPVRIMLHPISEGGFGLHIQIHHIAFDGGSLEIFLNELKETISGGDVEKTPDLYACHSKEMKKDQYDKEIEDSLAFYREMFEGGIPENEMPLKGARPKHHPVSDTVIEASLDEGEINALKEKASRFGITMFELLLSVSAAVLGKYCGSKDVVIGVPVNTRNDFSRKMIGMFVNTVPVRIRPERKMTIFDYFTETTKTVRKASRECNVPFEKLVGEFCSERDESRSPIFDVSVNYLTAPEPYHSSELSIDTVFPLQQMGRDVSIVMRNFKGSIQILLQYSSELFDRYVMKNFLEQFMEGLNILAWSDAVLVRDLIPLPEKQQLTLEKFAVSGKADLTVKTLHGVFEKTAEKYGEKKALVASDRTLTFDELNKEANHLAWNLINKGVNKGESIVLLLPRRSWYFSAMFGVLKAGAAFIPCDPDYPKERISHIIEDSGARFIITINEYLSDYPSDIALDIQDLISGKDTDNPEIAVSEDDLAYMIYTSGSTGKPKGVMLRHGGICNYLLPHSSNLHYSIISSEVSILLSITTISFDMSLKETTGALCNGKTLVFADEIQMNDPRELTKLFEETGADCFNATPSRYLQYLEYEPFAQALKRCVLVMAGGENFPKMLLEKLQGLGIKHIVNTYGPTEITVSSNAAELTDADRITIGRPLLNYEEYIVDSTGDPVPVGVTGELFIGGPGVAAGYKNLPKQTNDKFINYRGGRFFRSGDLAKWDKDGNVSILGRMDSQVKLRGLRIELSEIEELMETMPEIRKAVVAVRKLEGQEQLCAYYLSDKEIDEETLCKKLKEKLTAYMVPASFTRIEKIPVTANGKTDIKALPEPEIKKKSFTLPQTKLQQQIFDIASEVIGSTAFGIETGLFSVGLTSLSSVSLSIKLSEETGANIQIRELHEHDTVKELERLILNKNREEEFEVREEYAVTKNQEGIFFETMTHPDTTIYNIPTLLRLDKSIDMERLEAAVISAVNAHPYLLTRFLINENGEIRQKRGESDSFKAKAIERIHCNRISDVKDSLVSPFDIKNDLLIRVKFITAEEDKANYFFFDAHHILFDGISKVVLFDDISLAYDGKNPEKESYSGYEAALLEEKLRAGSYYEKAREYYRNLFEGCEPGCLPDPDVQESVEGSGVVTTAGRIVRPEEISAFCASAGISENALCTAAFGYTVAKYCGRDEAVFTTVNSGRNDPRFARSVSMFVKTTPVISRVSNRSILDYVNEIGNELMGAMTHDAYSFEEISREFGINADIIFAWQGIFAGKGDSFCGRNCKKLELALNEAKAPIEFMAYPESGSISFHCSYKKELYTEEFIRGFINVYERVLSEFMKKESLGEIELADEETIKKIESFNDTAMDFDGSDIVTLFRNITKNLPDNNAVVYKDINLTYRQADEITDRIAAYLADKGIGKGDVVSVLIPRCEYIVLASLGILKSGALYQPLDPEYPSERLEFMISDAEAGLLIADRSLIDRVPGYKGEILYTDEIQSLPESKTVPEGPSAGDGFIVLYTSGSTGTPKGVILEHSNIVNFCGWYRSNYKLTEKSRVAAYASYGFDANMMDLYPTLTSGACVYIIEEEMRLDFPALQKYFDDNSITHCFMTTQVGRQFAEHYSGTSLKYLSVGGEALAPMYPEGKPFEFYNIYGPTECTIAVTTFRVDRLYRKVPIGKPLSNVRLYVVDNNNRLLPPGIPGELLISGKSVGRGYLKRPEKTAEAFINNPFSADEGYQRAYRTGDIVRWTMDGMIDFTGRADGQVKIRGFRIELTEVESVIRQFEGIKDVTVQAFDAPAGGKFLAAYITSDNEVNVKDLGDFIREAKPAYMVPEVIMQIDSIPLNQNQKVNKKALPKPEINSKTDRSNLPAAPLNVLEKKIQDIVSSIVGTKEFGITDHLGDLGLTSISSIRLATLIYENFNVQINVRSLISEGSIQNIENEILTEVFNKDKEETQASVNIQHANSCRLSFAQQGVYAECQASPESVRYNLPFVMKFPKGISEKQLEDAVRTLIKAHEYILCRFIADSSDEIIQEPIPDYVPVIPVKEMTKDEFEAYKKDFVRPFDLEKGPCVRFEIVNTGELNLLLDMHHLVSDGATVDMFFRQVCEALDGKAPENENYTYYDFASEEKIEDETEEFFKGQMAEVEEATELIPDVFKEGLPHLEKNVSVETDIKSVKELAGKNGVTPAAVYLAACYITFGRYVCEDNVSIITISNGRSNVKLGNTFGMFVNTLPLVTTLDHHEKTADFIKRVAVNFSDTIEHENYPFARIASLYDFHPCISYAYQIGVMNDYKVKSGSVTISGLELDMAKVPVSVFINGTEDEAKICVIYDTALYSEAMMTDLAKCIENVVYGLINYDSVSEISLTRDEQWNILDSYNEPWDLNYDMSDSVVSRFKKIVAQNPEKIAAVFKDKAYTYKELDELTDILSRKIYQIACRVTGKTDLKEEVAAIILPRNEQTFILPMAAVKAGLGYEPLDPGYPPERLNFMVKDADVCLLIADDELAGIVNEYQGEVIKLSELYNMETPDITPAAPTPDSLFIMLYTSGSTGMPKGCQIENGNIVAYAHGMRNTFYTRNDNVAAYASFSFDVNMADVFCTLLVGGTVHVVPEEVRMNLDELARFFDESRITTLLLTTQVGVQFLQNYPKLKTMRLLVMGGEKLPAVEPSGISYTISNGYGPTENCCGVSIFPIKEWEPNIPIGKPIATIHAYVLDKTNHRLPAGAAGEYCLSGPQVSRGYLNRPDKTAEAYEDCPFNEFRMYHTGDIVRYRQTGDVEFVGRKDGQVKIRGFRIETKEVEAVIRAYENISDVTVQAYDYEGGGKYLAAFVVSKEKIDIKALEEFVKSQKPAYMVPAVIMQIDAIPLTINQKVDKKALPKPEKKKADYIAPETDTEKDFCTIFGNILGIDRVSVEDDFFAIGGSSILAMKVVIAAEKAGYKIVYNDLFKYTTARMMAEFLSKGKEKTSPVVETVTDYGNWTPPVIGEDSYDYTKIHELLQRNTMDAFLKGEANKVSDVLLLGATGYLGSHVLHEFILNNKGRIYCLIRPGKEQSGKNRLMEMQRYYFGSDNADLYDQRIFVIEGDVTDPAVLESFKAPAENMTAINCAASVKHFAKGNEIEKMNVNSVKNLTTWCERNSARLVHVSTGSVMGSRKNNIPPKSYMFDEHILYAGQKIDNNQYVHSKYMAERHIFEEIINNGLKAKVLRVGNLAPRESDGEFQINYKTNNIMNSLLAYKTLEKVSYDILDSRTEFSPIDYVAKAVLALAKTPDDCVCFAPLNPHRPLLGDIIDVISEAGYPISGAESDEVSKALNKALQDENKSGKVGSLIAYNNNDGVKEIGLANLDNSYTTHILKRLGFTWPETGSAYLRRLVNKMDQKGFFGREQ